MAISGVITSQTGARQFDGDKITKYSLFVGGNNATHHALANISPLLNGYGRLFMVRPPYAILKMFAGSDANLYSSENLFIQFKHMLEYMNRSVQGFGEKTLENAGTPIMGGFAGREYRTPTVTKDGTNSISISMFEMTGCPILTVIDGWMNAIGDENSGLATYGGWISGGTDDKGTHKRLYKHNGEDENGIPFNESNHTAEFIYVMHDRSGAQVERAVLLADVYPTQINQNAVLDYEGGNHDNVSYTINFNCVTYRSTIINAIANDLLKQYRIVSNSLNFNPELGDAVYAANDASKFQKSLGAVPVDSATGTNIGNLPAYYASTTPKTVTAPNKNINDGKLAGQEGREATVSWDGFAD